MVHRLVLPLVMICLPALASGQSPLDGLGEADFAEGEKVFKVHCARCHGIAGQGGEGSNLVRSKLKYAADDQALIDLIGGGIPGTGMPAIWTLDEERTLQVAGYVRSLGRLDAEEMPGDPQRGREVQHEELEEELSRSHAALTEGAERDEHREIEKEMKCAGMRQVAGDRSPPLESDQEISCVFQLCSKAGMAGRRDGNDGEQRRANGQTIRSRLV